MLKKLKPDAIALAAFFTAITGFYAITWGFMHGPGIARISDAFMSVEMYFWLSIENSSASRHIDQFFYLLLLFGSIMYVGSNKKENRLIRFCFAVIFISRVSAVMLGVTVLLSYWTAMTGSIGLMLDRLLFYASQAFWLWLSYAMLKKLKAGKELEATDHYYGDGVTYTEYERSSLWYRVFHFIIDQLLIALQFYGLFVLLLKVERFRDVAESLAHVLGSRLFVLVALIIFSSHLLYFN